MAEDQDQLRRELAKKFSERMRKAGRWARTDFMLAQVFTWLAILASFLSAILTAGETLKDNKLLLALLTAIPGTVIVIEKSFGFAKRARWHWEFEAALDKLHTQLTFGKKPIEQAAQEYGDLRVSMEVTFPAGGPETLGDGLTNRTDSSRAGRRKSDANRPHARKGTAGFNKPPPDGSP